MSEESDVIVAALTERMLHDVGESEANSIAALVFSIAGMALIIRSGAMTTDEAIHQIDSVFSNLPLGHRNDAAAERLNQAADWLRACVPDKEFQGKTIEGSAKPAGRRKSSR
jgi:hypothetical protein